MNFSAYTTETLEDLVRKIKYEISLRNKKEKANARVEFAKKLNPLGIDSKLEYKQEILKFNSESLLSLRNINNPHTARIKYLECLLSQNWSFLFPEKDTTEKYYVYAHVDPRNRIFVTHENCGGNYGGTPFYIGKGVGNRAFDLKRNQAHGKTIQAIREAGYNDSAIVKILFDNLTESKAFEIESKLIYFFQTKYENPQGALVNLEIPNRPVFVGEMEKILTNKQFEQLKEKNEGI
jgi:hypothetical protein